MTDNEKVTLEREVVEKLIRKIGADDVIIFNHDEAAALQSIAQLWLGWQSVGRFASGVKSFLTYIGWVVAFWIAIRNGLLDWIKGALK